MDPKTHPLGVVYDMPFEDYLAVDALSSSGLRVLQRSAWHYRNRVEIEPTRPMLRGTLAHCAVLEPDAMVQRYVVVPESAPRRPSKAQWAAKNPSPDSVAAMAWWTEFNAKAEGREIVTALDFAVTQAQLRALADEPHIAELLRTGRSEVSVFWVDKATGVYCKARPDHVHHVNNHQARLLDLKSTADESPSGFGRSAARLKYHLQAAHYVEGFERAAGMKVIDFTFAAVTNTEPVLAVPYVLTDEIAEQGRDEWRELLERFAWCKANDQWPPYGTGPQLLDFPAYAKRSTELEVSYAD